MVFTLGVEGNGGDADLVTISIRSALSGYRKSLNCRARAQPLNKRRFLARNHIRDLWGGVHVS